MVLKFIFFSKHLSFLHVYLLLLNYLAAMGEEHVITLDAETNLAIFYQAQEKFDLAEPLHLSSLAKKTKLYGEDGTTTLMTMNNLACVYGDLDQHDKAEKLFIRCLELRTAKFGEHHIDTVSTMSNLSGLYIKMGQLDKAELLCSKSVEISTKLLGTVYIHIYLHRQHSIVKPTYILTYCR